MWFTQLCPHREPPPAQDPGRCAEVRPDDRGSGVFGAHRAGLCSLRSRATSGASHGQFLCVRFQPDRLLQGLISISAAARQAARASSLERTDRCTQRSPRNRNTCQHVCARVGIVGTPSPTARASYPAVPPLPHPQIYSQQLRKQGVRG